MPGIVGLITRMSRDQAKTELLRMVQAIRHELSYTTGTCVDESLGVYVGWATRKGSFADQMPVCNERKDVSLVFSGEEFPEPGLISLLKQEGHIFDSAGASYIVHVYEDDSSFPAPLNGRFHGLVTDRTRGTTTLFNDRYGMHRLYYRESKESFYFAAEAKAILAVRPELRMADARSLGELVACGCVLENRTVFDGINVLPPAAAWVFRAGAIERKSTYFQPREWEEQAPVDHETYYLELRERFARRLPQYFNGRERIGMSLTGGLDTRMIMAWYKPEPGSLPCYTFGGILRDSQDVLVARQVAKVCEQPYEVISVGKEFLSRFLHYAERTVYVTDGCAAVYHSPDLYLNERAAEIAPIRMTGNYGGEVLRRVRAFKPVDATPGLYRPEFLCYVRAASQTYAEVIQTHPVSFAAFRQAPWYHYGLLALEESQLSVRSPYLDNDLVRTAFRAPTSALTNSNACIRLIAEGNAALRWIRTDRGQPSGGGRFPAAVSRSLLEFTFKSEYAYDYGMPQWLARIDHFFWPLHLEGLFLGRHKFCHFRVWYRDDLSECIREMLLDSRTLSRPYLERKGLEAIVQGHLRGDRNYTVEIHKVLTLELLHRLFLDSR